jgi:hypothetical protein
VVSDLHYRGSAHHFAGMFYFYLVPIVHLSAIHPCAASPLISLQGLLVSSCLRHYSQTSPYTQSVHLIGSWDNFSKHYAMERDSKRARGQWRGCYAFTDIICDGDGANGSKRTGGLKMGSTYYYYVGQPLHGTKNSAWPHSTDHTYM